MPALVARLPDRFDAAVLIGGGADVFRTISHSDLMGRKMTIRWRGRSPTAVQMKWLNEAVLERTALDPYHTAAFLAAMPVLQLHAKFDRIVPASTGELLYQRLGRPERWSYLLGHLGLFWWLPHEAGRIADWVEQATAPTPSAT